MTAPLPVAEFTHFDRLDIRVGRILSVEDFPEARKPLYKVSVDFGPEVGMNPNSAVQPPVPTAWPLVRKGRKGTPHVQSPGTGELSDTVRKISIHLLL